MNRNKKSLKKLALHSALAGLATGLVFAVIASTSLDEAPVAALFFGGLVFGTVIAAVVGLQGIAADAVGNKLRDGFRNVGFLSDPSNKICPQCAESVKGAAMVCRYCGYQLTQKSAPTTMSDQAVAGVPVAPPPLPPCPQCGGGLRYVTESNSLWCDSCQQYLSNQQHTNGNQP